ncbi:hypothetical protein ACFX58_10565 [Sphingomonas sp. NCPPB 2930]
MQLSKIQFLGQMIPANAVVAEQMSAATKRLIGFSYYGKCNCVDFCRYAPAGTDRASLPGQQVRPLLLQQHLSCRTDAAVSPVSDHAVAPADASAAAPLRHLRLRRPCWRSHRVPLFPLRLAVAYFALLILPAPTPMTCRKLIGRR